MPYVLSHIVHNNLRHNQVAKTKISDLAKNSYQKFSSSSLLPKTGKGRTNKNFPS